MFQSATFISKCKSIAVHLAMKGVKQGVSAWWIFLLHWKSFKVVSKQRF